ncbi:MAG: Electron transport complex subunit RsxA [candidate division WS2 bacterium]|nr:Electron transport complex subunit RsxA [Candidatus Lithacetigena glycinireducens]
MDLLKLFIAALLVNNIVLMRFLALCSYVGMTAEPGPALGMGWAVTFVMVLAGVVTWFLNVFVLQPLGLTFLSTLIFILVIASLVQLVEIYLRKSIPSLYHVMGIYLPLITTNCAILGLTFINQREGFTLIQSIVNSIGVAWGYTLAMLLLANLRQRIKHSNVPKFLDGYPIVFILTAILAVAFMGFTGMAK